MLKHKWVAQQLYTGQYTNPETGASYSTQLHTVKCAECQKVVSDIPDTTLPDLGGCPGRKPLNDSKPRATVGQFQL